VEILKQPQFSPMGDLEQVISIHAAGSGLLDEVPLEKISEFESRIMDQLKTSHADLSTRLASGARMDEATVKELNQAITAFAKTVR
jgi:F-type H+-transporting ATPase subunit alpha